MEYVWELIAPWVAAIGGAGGIGAIIYAIARGLVNKVLKKNNTMLDAAFNVDAIGQKLAEKLAGKTLNIDVTAVTEKALKKLAKQLDEKIQKVEDSTNAYRRILALIAKGISKLKALSKDEVTELNGAIQAIENEYIPPEENQTMTVMLQPITLAEEKNESPTGGVNFNGLGDE